MSAGPLAAPSATGDPVAHRSLPRDSVRFLRTVALSVGIQGPTAGVIVGPAVLASIVGGAGALSYLLGLVAMAFVAYAFVLFSRSFNSSSSVFAFNGSTLGARVGFVSAWLLLLVYVSFAAGVYASTADLAGAFLGSVGVQVWWVWLALAGWALTMVFAYASFGLSAVVILACEGVAVVLVAIVGVAALVHGGGSGSGSGAHSPVSLAPFATHGVALSVLGLGVVNAFSAFSGFEGAATLGEESVRARRTIPASVAGSLLGSAAVYIVITWIVDNAYRSPAALAAAPAPLVHLASVDIGTTMGRLVNVAGVISAFGAQLACINAANRLTFSLGRELGAGTRWGDRVTRVSARRGSPVGALWCTGAVSLVALLAFSFEHDAIRALTFIVEFGAYLILVVYLLTVIAALVLVWRRESGRRRAIPAVVLLVGVVVLGYVLRDTFTPLPTGPFAYVGIAAAASVAAGLALAVAPGVQRRLSSSALLAAAQASVGLDRR